MSVRRSLAGVLSATLVGSALVLASGGTAHAAVDPDDTTSFTPVAADVIGAGSDTSQNALFRLANAYNATTPAPAARLFTYAATGGGQVTLPSGAVINRPNGSGSGKGRLYGANNTPDIDFARSSSSLNPAEVDAGLQAFPFALDTLGVAVSGTVASNAPASLTEAQILGIYKGDFTTWNQVGGTSTATIAAKIPQSGSGTGDFFRAELVRINGGQPVTIAGSVAVVQEHDPTPVQADPNAIAPFSVGRAGLEGNKLRVPSGFSADRALYNVVRGTSVADADVQAVFAPAGYICSDAARALIEQAGFKQLARPDADGVCGVATTAKTTDFTTNEPVVTVPTTTTVAAVSPGARQLRLTARVAGTPTPGGTVTFVNEATDTSFATVPVIGGTATLSRTVTPGTYRVSAVYNPTEGSAFEASASAAATVRVRTTSSIKESFAASLKKTAKSARGVVTVTLAGTSAKATGRVTIKEGSRTVATGTLRAGKATITLAKAKVGKGKSTLRITFAGDASSTASSKTFTITFKK